MSISLLISSKYSSLESDRSKFQIYKNIKKEYEAFQAAESVTNMDLLDLCELEPVSVKDRRLFNLLFSPGAEESLDQDPVEVLEFEEVNAGNSQKCFLSSVWFWPLSLRSSISSC